MRDPLGIRHSAASTMASNMGDQLEVMTKERDAWREVCQRMISQPITPTVANIIQLGVDRDDVDAMLRVLRNHEETTDD